LGLALSHLAQTESSQAVLSLSRIPSRTSAFWLFSSYGATLISSLKAHNMDEQ